MINAKLPDKGLFRISDWWGKAALLMGMVYLFTAWFGIPFEKFVWLSILSIATISGFAATGYLVNDLFDIKADIIAGKRNLLAGKPWPLALLLFVTAIILLFLPWKFLPLNFTSAALIAAELILFWAYSAPPLRLKERGLLGVFIDAAYAHAVPVLLAAYTFSLAAGKKINVLPALFLIAWQILSGVRNILLHQFEDRMLDAVSQTKNITASVADSRFYLSIAFGIAIELTVAICFFVAVSFHYRLLVLGVPVILTLILVPAYLFRNKGMEQMLQSEWKYFPNNIFEKWLPPAVLFILSYADLRYLPVLLIHTILFNYTAYVELLHHGILPLRDKMKYFSIQSFIGIRRFLSFIINWFIYYCFLVFGVDLKKENTSAVEYWKRQRKAK